VGLQVPQVPQVLQAPQARLVRRAPVEPAALVRPDGGIVSQSGGITLAAKPAAGQYILNFGSAVTGHPIIASGAEAADNSDQRGETTAGPCGGGTEGVTCSSSDNTNSVLVQTRTSAGTLGDHAFYVAIVG
jgi:hypothetical protein